MDTPEKDIVRDQIIAAASIVFGKYGYKKATMDEIGMATGKGKTAIYYYYKNKEDVFRAVIEKEASILARSLSETVASKSGPVEKIDAYCRARATSLLKVSNFYNAMKNELLQHLAFLNEVRQQYDRAEIKMVADILQEGNKGGVFQVKDLEITAATIVAVLKALEIPYFGGDIPKDIDDRISGLVNLLCYGIVKR
jgi:AcrR family transcriptional regulator